MTRYPEYQRFISPDVDYATNPEAQRVLDVKVKSAIMDDYYNNQITEDEARIRHQQYNGMMPDPFYDAVLREDTQ